MHYGKLGKMNFTSRRVFRPIRSVRPSRPSVRIEAPGGQQAFRCQPILDLPELLLVLRPVDQDLELGPERTGRLHRVAPVRVHVHRTLGERVVDEQDTTHHVVVRFGLLHDARDGMVGDEVLDLFRLPLVVLPGDVLDDLDALRAHLQGDFHGFQLPLFVHQVSQDGPDVLFAAKAFALLSTEEPHVVGLLLHVFSLAAAKSHRRCLFNGLFRANTRRGLKDHCRIG